MGKLAKRMRMSMSFGEQWSAIYEQSTKGPRPSSLKQTQADKGVWCVGRGNTLKVKVCSLNPQPFYLLRKSKLVTYQTSAVLCEQPNLFDVLSQDCFSGSFSIKQTPFSSPIS